jgi:hypothetical protein
MPVSIVEPPLLINATDSVSEGVQTVTFTWKFQTTVSATLTDNLPHVVKTLSGLNLATEGTAAPGLPLCTCRSTKLDRGDKNGIYVFTATYSDKAVDNSADTPAAAVQLNPLNDPPVIVPTAGMKQRAVYLDRDGNGLLNSAKDPVIESMDDNTISFQIKANVPVNMPVTVLDFLNTCNDAAIVVGGLTVTANAARFVLQSNFLSEPKTRNGHSYREFTFEIWIDERDKHYAVPLDAGFRERVELLDTGDVSFDPPQFEQRKIVLDDGSEPSEPIPLSEGLRITDPTPETVEYLEFKLYPEADYTTLPGITAVAP